MKRFVAMALLVAGIAIAQAWDFEVGKEFSVSNYQRQQAWYAMARYNLPLSSEVLGAKLWALPEAGVWIPDGKPYYGYVRLQFLVDQTYGTLFVDTRYEFSPEKDDVIARIGIRFGWPP